MMKIKDFPILHDFLSHFFRMICESDVLVWPEKGKATNYDFWNKAFSEFGIEEANCSWGWHLDSRFGNCVIDVRRSVDSELYIETTVINSNYGIFCICLGKEEKRPSLELYFTSDKAPPFLEELILAFSTDQSREYDIASVQELRISGVFTVAEFFSSFCSKPLNMILMG